jgi:hypothetical protein
MGNIILEEGKILQRWKDYFESILKNHTTGNSARTEVHWEEEEEEVLEPSHNEVREIIKKLKNNKAPGSDGIVGELLKQGGTVLWRRLHKLTVQIWRQEKIPEELKPGIIYPIHKKK